MKNLDEHQRHILDALTAINKDIKIFEQYDGTNGFIFTYDIDDVRILNYVKEGGKISQVHFNLVTTIIQTQIDDIKPEEVLNIYARQVRRSVFK